MEILIIILINIQKDVPLTSLPILLNILYLIKHFILNDFYLQESKLFATLDIM